MPESGTKRVKSEQEDPREDDSRPSRFISVDDGRCFRNHVGAFFVIPLFQLNGSLIHRTTLVESVFPFTFSKNTNNRRLSTSPN